MGYLKTRFKGLMEVAEGAKETKKSKFVIEDAGGSSDSDDPFQNEEGINSVMSGNTDDPTKLIDLELIKLLRYCLRLREYKSKDEYEDELMLKAFTLGKC